MRLIKWLAWQIYRLGTMVNIPLPTPAVSPEYIEGFIKYWDDPENFRRVTEKLRKLLQ